MAKALVILLVLAVITFSIIDVFFNLLSFIPFVGGILETTSETILEILTIFSTIILGMLAIKEK